MPMLRSDAASPFFRRLHEDERTVVYERIAAGEDSRFPLVRR